MPGVSLPGALRRSIEPGTPKKTPPLGERCGGVPAHCVRKIEQRATEGTLPAMPCSASKGSHRPGAKDLNAQREQRDCAHTHDQDQQCHGVVVKPMSAWYTHDAPRPEKTQLLTKRVTGFWAL